MNGLQKFYLVVMLILLAGCANNVQWSTGHVFPHMQARVVDYSQEDCQLVWSLADNEAINNALYWLRLNQCSQQLAFAQLQSYWQPLSSHWQQLLDSNTLPWSQPTMTLLLAAPDADYQQWLADNSANSSLLTLPRWAILFKQNILAGRLNVTEQQRLQLFDQLSRYQGMLPSSIQGVYQLWQQQFFLWRQQQNNRKIQALLNSKDEQLAQLQLKYRQQSQQLITINHKLTSLAEIEKQLSSRKQMTSGMVAEENAPTLAAPAAKQKTPDSQPPTATSSSASQGSVSLGNQP